MGPLEFVAQVQSFLRQTHQQSAAHAQGKLPPHLWKRLHIVTKRRFPNITLDPKDIVLPHSSTRGADVIGIERYTANPDRLLRHRFPVELAMSVYIAWVEQFDLQ